MRNANKSYLKSLFCNGEGKVIRNPYLGQYHQKKVNKNKFFRLVGQSRRQVLVKSAHCFFSNAAHMIIE